MAAPYFWYQYCIFICNTEQSWISPHFFLQMYFQDFLWNQCLLITINLFTIYSVKFVWINSSNLFSSQVIFDLFWISYLLHFFKQCVSSQNFEPSVNVQNSFVIYIFQRNWISRCNFQSVFLKRECFLVFHIN